MATHIEITQTRSGIGQSEKQRQTLLGLGLRGPHSSKTLNDTPPIRGMIMKVQHLVEVKVRPGENPHKGKRHPK